MKSNTKKIIWLGVGLTLLFAMVILPLGVAIAIRPSLLPDLDAGIPQIDTDDPFVGVDYDWLGWDGTYSSGGDYSIAPI